MHGAKGRKWIAYGAVLILLLGALFALSGRLNNNAAMPADSEDREIRLEERGLEFLTPGEHLASQSFTISRSMDKVTGLTMRALM